MHKRQSWHNYQWTDEEKKEIEGDAYFKWIDAGRPHDKNDFFWQRAVKERYARKIAPDSKINSSMILDCPDCREMLWSGKEWLDYCSCGWTEPFEVIEVNLPRKSNRYHDSSYIYYDSSYVCAPYIPLTTTPTVLDPDIFRPSRGILTKYGKKMIQEGSKYYKNGNSK